MSGILRVLAVSAMMALAAVPGHAVELVMVEQHGGTDENARDESSSDRLRRTTTPDVMSVKLVSAFAGDCTLLELALGPSLSQNLRMKHAEKDTCGLANCRSHHRRVVIVSEFCSVG